MKRFLLTGVAVLALVACDDVSSTSTPSEQGLSSMMMLMGAAEPEPSWAGSYLSAKFAQDRFDWPRAQVFLTQAVQYGTQDPAQNRRLMLLAIGSGDLDSAAAMAKDLSVKEDPTGVTAFVKMMDPLRSGDWEAAVQIFADWPGHTALPLLRRWIELGRGEKNLPKLSGKGLDVIHHVMMADFLNDTAALQSLAKTNIEDSIQNIASPIAVERLGDIFARRGLWDKAAALYALALEINNQMSGVADKLAAVKEKRTPENIAPANTSVQQALGQLFFDIAASFYNDRSVDSALIFTRLSLAMDPTAYATSLLLGNILAAQDQTKAAIDVFQTVPASAPQYLAVQQKIASLQLDLDQDDQAVAALETLVAGDHTPEQKIDFLVQIGDIHRDNEDFKSAIRAYDRAVDLLPDGKPSADHWDLLYARGMTLERLKRWPEAEKDLQAALTFQPDHPYILNYLGYSWADQGHNLDQAMTLLKKAVDIVPNDGYVTDSVGWVYYRMQKYPEAIEYLERAVELLPYDPTVNDHLGDAYWQAGRKREARFQWQRALNYSEEAEQKAAIEGKLEKGLVAKE